MTKIFFDAEFTGLHQNTTLVSLGLVAETRETFYAEFDDYDMLQVDGWIRDNVIANLLTLEHEFTTSGIQTQFVGDSNGIAYALRDWLGQFDKVEMWGDCLAWDWVLFCELFGGALNIPQNIYYIPFDISTLFKMRGIDPDINREVFVGNVDWLAKEEMKHNALWDALVIQACYEKLTS